MRPEQAATGHCDVSYTGTGELPVPDDHRINRVGLEVARLC
jgi:hypothetical protein